MDLKLKVTSVVVGTFLSIGVMNNLGKCPQFRPVSRNVYIESVAVDWLNTGDRETQSMDAEIRTRQLHIHPTHPDGHVGTSELNPDLKSQISSQLQKHQF